MIIRLHIKVLGKICWCPEIILSIDNVFRDIEFDIQMAKFRYKILKILPCRHIGNMRMLTDYLSKLVLVCQAVSSNIRWTLTKTSRPVKCSYIACDLMIMGRKLELCRYPTLIKIYIPFKDHTINHEYITDIKLCKCHPIMSAESWYLYWVSARLDKEGKMDIEVEWQRGRNSDHKQHCGAYLQLV